MFVDSFFILQIHSPFNDVKNVPLPADSSPPLGCCGCSNDPPTDPPPTEFIETDEAIEEAAVADEGAMEGVEEAETNVPAKAC